MNKNTLDKIKTECTINTIEYLSSRVKLNKVYFKKSSHDIMIVINDDGVFGVDMNTDDIVFATTKNKQDENSLLLTIIDDIVTLMHKDKICIKIDTKDSDIVSMMNKSKFTDLIMKDTAFTNMTKTNKRKIPNSSRYTNKYKNSRKAVIKFK